ncbi:MAG: hypothetical protein OXJ90_17225 [Spirochaetaceae bacterium]|nr:hypothetical protein [Spirochaetaceae bacterium]
MKLTGVVAALVVVSVSTRAEPDPVAAELAKLTAAVERMTSVLEQIAAALEAEQDDDNSFSFPPDPSRFCPGTQVLKMPGFECPPPPWPEWPPDPQRPSQWPLCPPGTFAPTLEECITREEYLNNLHLESLRKTEALRRLLPR